MNDKVHLIGGKSYKESDVVVLATTKQSSLYYLNGKFKLGDDTSSSNDCNRHLYFLSNDEYKEGDWVYCTLNNIIHRVDTKGISFNSNRFEWHKIIASTDKSLGLARLSNDFLKKYCELGGISKVLIEYEYIGQDEYENYFDIKVALDNTITIKPFPVKETSWKTNDVRQLCWEAYTAHMGKIPIHRLDDVVREFEEWLAKKLNK